MPEIADVNTLRYIVDCMSEPSKWTILQYGISLLVQLHISNIGHWLAQLAITMRKKRKISHSQCDYSNINFSILNKCNIGTIGDIKSCFHEWANQVSGN